MYDFKYYLSTYNDSETNHYAHVLCVNECNIYSNEKILSLLFNRLSMIRSFKC